MNFASWIPPRKKSKRRTKLKEKLKELAVQKPLQMWRRRQTEEELLREIFGE